MNPDFKQELFRISDRETFSAAALEVFHFQSTSVPVYRDYLNALKVEPEKVSTLEEIPFLPVEFFKSHRVIAEGMEAEEVFESSGTTGSTSASTTGSTSVDTSARTPGGTTSHHYVADAALYRESFLRSFNRFYGSPEERCILALLPSYMERSGSSLVYMMDQMIKWSGHPDSGFYLENLEELSAILKKRNSDGHPTLLLGVSFALLELAERHPLQLGGHIKVMETGGMKGRRKELVRGELHEILTGAFGVPTIHSEYGMTELLSQAYSRGEGIFHTPPWMDLLIRDPNDPLSLVGEGHTGGLNIIDLANLYSCSFIATGDLGKRFEDGSFEVLGRFDHSDIRGCNLLVS
ncbi:MAG: acyl transferase [Bacteroidota bacterium]